MPLDEDLFDVAVIGAGIIGTCAAYHCARLGLKTVNLEQYEFGHRHGSSHGKSRITRMAHADGACIPIVTDSYQQIAELEARRGEQFWMSVAFPISSTAPGSSKTGLLWIGGPVKIASIHKTCAEAGCEMEMMMGSQVSTRFPLFSFDDSWRALYDSMGGIALADRWMRTFHEEYMSTGGVFRENCEVRSIESSPESVTIKTSQGDIKARKVIVAAGVWVNKLLPELKVKSKNVLKDVPYWKVRNSSDSELLEPANLPVFIAYDKDGGDDFYGLPSLDHPGTMKFVDDNRSGYEFASGELPSGGDDKTFVKICSAYIRGHMPSLSTEPAVVERCKYSFSPDYSYIIDDVDTEKNVVVCGMMSGSGFKLAPGLGRALAHMVSNRQLPFDLSSFRLNRFLSGGSKM